LAVDLRGHGGSFESERDDLDWQQFSPADWKKMLIDVESVVAKVNAHQSNTPIWLIGASLGANLAINYAVDDPGIKGVILLSPGLNYFGIETLSTVQKYSPRPLLIVASKDDARARQAAEDYAQFDWGLKKTILYTHAGHGNAMVSGVERLKYEMLEWLNQK